MGKRQDKDTVWQREKVASPCVHICVVHHETELCTGCARSVDEIARWSRMSEEERQTIMAELPNRQAVPTKRRGGRSRRRGA